MVPRAPLWGYRGRISLAHPPRPTVRSRLCAARFTSTSPPPSSRAGEGRRPHYALWTALALGAAAAAAYHSDFLRRLGGSDDAAGLSPHRWTPLTVSSVEDLPDGLTKIITLTLPQTASGSSTASDGDGRLHIDTVYVKQPDLMIQRPYTPLDPLFDGASSIRLLVKRYADGEVSSYLHRLGPGAKVEVRGPERSWQEQREGQVREIVFIAGGTGVTPFIQLLRRLHANVDPSNPDTGHASPSLRLIFSARTSPLLYLRSQIEALADVSSGFSTVFIVSGDAPDADESDGWWSRWFGSKGEAERKVASGHPNVELIRRAVGAREPAGEGRIILVAGPEGMIEAVAGRKGPDGRTQGPLGGVLKELGYRSEEVFKL